MSVLSLSTLQVQRLYMALLRLYNIHTMFTLFHHIEKVSDIIIMLNKLIVELCSRSQK